MGGVADGTDGGTLCTGYLKTSFARCACLSTVQYVSLRLLNTVGLSGTDKGNKQVAHVVVAIRPIVPMD